MSTPTEQDTKPRGFTMIVTGGRDFSDLKVFHSRMDQAVFLMVSMRGGVALGEDFQLRVAHGCCPTGADAMARKWARYSTIGALEVPYPADWETHGKSAGPKRNSAMVDAERERADLCLAFWDGFSTGTRDCYTKASQAGIPVLVVHY